MSNGPAITPDVLGGVPEMYPDPVFGNWFAGFVDGEGCFLIWGGGRVSHVCKLVIALRSDDAPILDEIRERLGMGVIGHYSSPSIEAVGKPPRSMLTIARKADCLRLVRLFDAHPLRAKKFRDYAIWREAVHEVHSAHRSQGRLAKLKAQLEAVRAYGSRGDELPPAVESLAQVVPLFDMEAA